MEQIYMESGQKPLLVTEIALADWEAHSRQTIDSPKRTDFSLGMYCRGWNRAVLLRLTNSFSGGGLEPNGPRTVLRQYYNSAAWR
jgi:hypothetical protein